MRDEWFERLYTEHAHGLLGFLLYRTGDLGLAEDLLGDAFERAMRGRKWFDRRRGSEKTWLFAIALNCLRDHVRRQGVEARAMQDAAAWHLGQAETEGMSAVDLRQSVLRALDVLSEEEREAVALRYGADLTFPEIARATGVTLTTIEGRVYRALRKLRPQLAQDC